jgi:hypothetical protein
MKPYQFFEQQNQPNISQFIKQKSKVNNQSLLICQTIEHKTKVKPFQFNK